MKKIISLLMVCFMAFSVMLTVPERASVNSIGADAAAQYANSQTEEYARRVAALVNRERAADGLPMLKFSDKLNEAALKRADEIQRYFSHTRPDGRSCFTAITDMGIRYRYAGENIAYGQRTPETVMDGWMNSSGHRANILSRNAEYIGVGVTYRNGVYYWTQFFASADGLSGEVITDGPDTVTTTLRNTEPATTTTAATTVRTTTAQKTTTRISTTVPKTTAKTTTAASTTPSDCASGGGFGSLFGKLREMIRYIMKKC